MTAGRRWSLGGRLPTYLLTFGFWVVFGWVARTLFLLFHRGAASQLRLGEIVRTFGAGLRMDLSAAAYLTLVPTLLLIVSTWQRLVPLCRIVAAIWIGFVAIAGSFLIAIDLETFRHWDRRIDAMVLTYLKTPWEALASAGGSPTVLLAAIAVGFAVVALVGYRRVVDRRWQRLEPISALWAVPMVLLIGPLFVVARGGIQEIALTQSSGYFSTKPFANFAAQNALWDFFDSVSRGLDDSVNHFQSMSPSEAVAALDSARASVGGRKTPPLRIARPNILIVIWESGAAPAFGSLGGLPDVTPRFDALAREGILFRSMYAAGDRTDKGVAAVLSGFPGLPTGSILKIPTRARALPMVTEDLRRSGYRTSFFYGGELEFASMQAYLYEAGFDRIVGKKSFPRSSWNSKWGAHDGVVATRVLDELSRETEPFAAVWLTLSSHEPFETPSAPKFPGEGWRPKYLSSMAYTDSVLGAVIDTARTRPWWSNTLVVIVADHGKRVTESDTQPFRDADALFRIPMLWVGGALTARDSVVTEVASQLDVAPTLIDLVGAGDPDRYRWGRSLLRPTRTPFAYYGFEQGFGIVTERGYQVYDHRAGRIPTVAGQPTPADEHLGRAIFQLTYQQYLELGRRSPGDSTRGTLR